jgi:GT2 family glycosyltransferase
VTGSLAEKNSGREHFNPPPVSAVVVNFNGGDCIATCLEALYSQQPPLAEIIVVDNASTDGSPGRIRTDFPEVRLIELVDNRGPSIARNIGLQQAGSDLVLLLDDDVYLAEDTLSCLLAAYQREQATVICPRVILMPETDIVQCDGAEMHFVGTLLLRHGYRPLAGLPAQATAVGGCISACLLVRRTDLLAAGGFNEDYFIYFEDLEFSVRMRGLGHQLFCEPAAVVFHDRGEGTPGLSFRGQGSYPSRRVYLHLRNRLMTILIHYRMRTLIVLSPALLGYELAQLVTVLMRGWLTAWGRAFLSILGQAGHIRQERQQVQHRRRVNDREILVGGPLPLAPGFIRSRPAQLAVTILSTVLNAYWRLAQPWIT